MLTQSEIELLAQIRLDGNRFLSQVTAVSKTANRILGNIKVDDRTFTAPLGRMSRSASDFEKSMGAANSRVLAFAASAGAMFAVQRAFRATAQSMIEVESALADINIVLNTDSKSLQRFGDALFDVAKNTKQSFKTVSQAAVELARQGLGIEETLKRTRDAMILVRRTGMDTVNAVESITATINSFSRSVIDSTRLVSQMIRVDQAFAVSSKDLAEAIKRVGSTAEDSGVSIEKLMGLVTTAAQITGRSGSVIGNSFKTIFQRLQRPQTLELLRSLGVEVENTTEGFLSADRVLVNLAQKYKTMDPLMKNQVVQLAAGVHQANVLRAVMSDLSNANGIMARSTTEAMLATDEATRSNEKLNETFDSLVNRVKQGATQVSAKLGEFSLEPMFRTIVGGTDHILTFLNKISDETDKTGAVLRAVFGGIGKLLSGPGLLVGLSVLGRLMFDFGKFAKDSMASLLPLNTAYAQQANIQKEINAVIAQNPSLQDAIINRTHTRAQIEAQILNTMRAQALQQKALQSFSVGATQTMYQGGMRINRGGEMSIPRRPRFANPLRSAIQREMSSGVPASTVRVGQDNRLVSNFNPQGIGVYNTVDEPKGLGQGISRAIKEGKNPKTYNVPGFAMFPDGSEFSARDVGRFKKKQSLLALIKTLESKGLKTRLTESDIQKGSTDRIKQKLKNALNLYEANPPLPQRGSLGTQGMPRVQRTNYYPFGNVATPSIGPDRLVQRGSLGTQGHFANQLYPTNPQLALPSPSQRKLLTAGSERFMMGPPQGQQYPSAIGPANQTSQYSRPMGPYGPQYSSSIGPNRPIAQGMLPLEFQSVQTKTDLFGRKYAEIQKTLIKTDQDLLKVKENHLQNYKNTARAFIQYGTPIGPTKHQYSSPLQPGRTSRADLFSQNEQTRRQQTQLERQTQLEELKKEQTAQKRIQRNTNLGRAGFAAMLAVPMATTYLSERFVEDDSKAGRAKKVLTSDLSQSLNLGIMTALFAPGGLLIKMLAGAGVFAAGTGVSALRATTEYKKDAPEYLVELERFEKRLAETSDAIGRFGTASDKISEVLAGRVNINARDFATLRRTQTEALLQVDPQKRQKLIENYQRGDDVFGDLSNALASIQDEKSIGVLRADIASFGDKFSKKTNTKAAEEAAHVIMRQMLSLRAEDGEMVFEKLQKDLSLRTQFQLQATDAQRSPDGQNFSRGLTTVGVSQQNIDAILKPLTSAAMKDAELMVLLGKTFEAFFEGDFKEFQKATAQLAERERLIVGDLANFSSSIQNQINAINKFTLDLHYSNQEFLADLEHQNDIKGIRATRGLARLEGTIPGDQYRQQTREIRDAAALSDANTARAAIPMGIVGKLNQFGLKDLQTMEGSPEKYRATSKEFVANLEKNRLVLEDASVQLSRGLIDYETVAGLISAIETELTSSADLQPEIAQSIVDQSRALAMDLAEAHKKQVAIDKALVRTRQINLENYEQSVLDFRSDILKKATVIGRENKVAAFQQPLILDQNSRDFALERKKRIDTPENYLQAVRDNDIQKISNDYAAATKTLELQLKDSAISEEEKILEEDKLFNNHRRELERIQKNYEESLKEHSSSFRDSVLEQIKNQREQIKQERVNLQFLPDLLKGDLELGKIKSQANLRTIEGKRKLGYGFSDEYANSRLGARVDDLSNNNDFNFRRDASAAAIGTSFTDQLRYDTKDLYRDLMQGAAELSKTMKDGFKDAFKSFVDGTADAEEALRNLGISVFDKILDKSLDASLDMVVGGVTSLGGSYVQSFRNRNQGGIMKYGTGGKVKGGSGVKDDVPALLTRGEYVLKRAAVNKYGDKYLSMLNGGEIPKFQDGGSSTKIKLPNEFLYDDEKRPTKGNMNVSPFLSNFGLSDEDQLTNVRRMQRESDLFGYLKDKRDYDKQVKDSLKAFKQGQQQRLIGAYIAAATQVVGAGIQHGANVYSENVAGQQALAQQANAPKYYQTQYGLPPRRSQIGMHNKGGIIGFADGGLNSRDNIPAMLTGGEYVIKKSVVDTLGQDYFNRLNKLEIPKFESGGRVPFTRFTSQSTTNGPVNQTTSSSDLLNALMELVSVSEELKKTIEDSQNQSKNNGSQAMGKGSNNSAAPITNNVSINVTVEESGKTSSNTSSSSDNDKKDNGNTQDRARLLAKTIESKVVEVIVKQQRPGGLLADTVKR